ncbi:MAG: hypothetical protein ACFFA0_05095 [Promethearchaeota archaeon]
MSLKTIEKKTKVISETELKYDASPIITAFSEISSQTNVEYIYTGEEKIPFKDRHPVYQALMLNEFCIV